MSTRPGLQKVIEYAGLSEKVTDLIFKQNLTYKQIAEKLKLEDNLDISESALSYFKKYVIDSVPDFLQRNEKYRDSLAKKYLDTVENLVYALEKIKSKIDEFDEKKDWKAQSVYLSLLLGEMQMLLKRAGEIKPAQFVANQEINMVQINNYVQIELVRLIDEGKIPLEQCAPEIQSFYHKAKASANH